MDRLLIIGILLFSVTSYAQGTQPDMVKLKADAQKVVSIIKGDKAKTQTYCQIEYMDPRSREGQEIASIIGDLDTSCED